MPEKVDEFVEIPINPSEICYRAFELMGERQFDEAEKLLNKNMGRVDNEVAVGLFHSALGVLFKLKGEPKAAWKHYQRAEKLIPDDPALKIIIARLLIEHFAEYDQALRRAKKVFDTVKDNPVFSHQVHITLGLAYLGKGDKKRSVEMLSKAMEHDFEGFVSTDNIDFKLVEMLLRRKMGVPECKTFLQKARDFAHRVGEATWVELIDRMLEGFGK